MNPTTEQQREWAKRQAERLATGASRHQHDTLTCWLCPVCGAISDTRWHMQQHVDRRPDRSCDFPTPHCRGGGKDGEDALELSALLVGVGRGNAKKDTP